ncbi:MAG: type II toxin-antitoxin system Phd/YefM family antitoxin [Bacilli bacterium]|nr:type II toxin-antitoxin system Phd/YefM family antitoxin [Bacilli bacterium]
MSTINITNARQNLFQLVADVNVGFNPITIVNNKGKNAVLISEDEWKNIEETLFLSSIPGYVDKIKKIDAEENWQVAEEYDPYGEWK